MKESKWVSMVFHNKGPIKQYVNLILSIVIHDKMYRDKWHCKSLIKYQWRQSSVAALGAGQA